MIVMRLFLLLTSALFCSVTKSSETSSIVAAIGYGATVVIDTCSILSKKVRYGLYGDGLLSAEAEKSIRSMIEALNLPQPVEIKYARWPWNIIAGTAFSNNDTLFIGEIDVLSLNKKELITSLLMIDADYDKKLMILSVAVPVGVWSVARLSSYISKRIKSVIPLNYAIHVAHYISEKFDQSFKAKALASLSIIMACICYERHLFNTRAHALMMT